MAYIKLCQVQENRGPLDYIRRLLYFKEAFLKGDYFNALDIIQELSCDVDLGNEGIFYNIIETMEDCLWSQLRKSL